jgi:hypothetical protein
MRQTLVLSLAAAALLAGTTAYARSPDRGETSRADLEQRTNALFGRMDVNDDGLLDDADREATRRQAFDRLDADKDGAISFAEFEAQREGRREARAERRGSPEAASERSLARRGMRGPGGRGMARAADADGDGAVSQAEFAAASLARFDRVDTDGDGTISLEERREARQHMRRDMRRGRPGRDAG